MKSFGAIAPIQDSHLKAAERSFNTFPVIFQSGILTAITKLKPKYTYIGLDQFVKRKLRTFKKALEELPYMLSQLPYLRELAVSDIDCECDDLAELPRTHSTSLQTLDIDGSMVPTLSSSS